MLNPKKIIDIYPPEKLKEQHYFLADKEIEKDKKIARPERKKGSRFKKSIIFISLFLVAGFLFLHFVLARVSIEIWPETQNLNLDEKITADVNAKEFELASNVIPGLLFETEKSASQQFTTTGKVQKEKNAQGTIRVYNNYSSAQTLVQNTRFQPALDKVIYFRSTKTVIVPAKGYLDVAVKADRPGEEYNIAPATFSVPGLAGLPQYYSIYGKSFSQMTGGFSGLASQVKDEDLELAKKSLLEKIRNDAKDYFSQKSSQEFIFLDEAMVQEILEASSSLATGTEADSFRFNLKTKTRALAFKKSDLDNFVKELVKSKIQNSDKTIEGQSLKVDYSVDRLDIDSGKLTLNLKVSVKAYSDIDQESVKKALLGKSIKESEALLANQPSIVKVKFKAFPLWLRSLPENEKKISVRLNID